MLNSPLPGGKSQKPLKFCKSHQSQSAETSAEVSVPPEFNAARAEVGLLTEDECLAQQNAKGCKKKENISLFYQTTAVMLGLIMPCGIVVCMTKMFTSESTPRYFFSS